MYIFYQNLLAIGYYSSCSLPIPGTKSPSILKFTSPICVSRTLVDSMYTSRDGTTDLTSFLMNLEAHLRSAFLHMSQMSLPERWTDISPRVFSSSLLNYLAYLSKMELRVPLSGSSNLMLRSSLDTSAGSRSFFLFEAQITSTSPSLSKLSIFLSNVERILLVASWSPDSLDVARESTSSMKSITDPIAAQASNISANLLSDSP